MQSHHFQYTYDPAIGYTIKLHHLTDGGTFTCSAGPPNDSNGNEIHFDVYVTSELKKCSTDKISNGVSSNITASNINVTLSKLRPSKRDLRSKSWFIYIYFVLLYCVALIYQFFVPFFVGCAFFVNIFNSWQILFGLAFIFIFERTFSINIASNDAFQVYFLMLIYVMPN